MATTPYTKPVTSRSGVNLPPLKNVQANVRTLGSLKLPVSKAPAQRGGCCGR